MTVLNVLLVLCLIVLAVFVVMSRNMLASVVLFSAYGLIMALLWQRLGAPMLALAEVVIESGIISVLFVVSVFRISKDDVE
ncbi:DUF4040 domain-containing protein [Candidatus Oleimmundimicrobium sp.]|uniref:Na(+)/H(+) antiporter subunit B n=1 Tax=Candidatus Oleimmundimicrobium sp. TaxID=3060597 RepID=UPI0027265A42|nr:DUF4040 domain-containing protein [Candidatus Oleimmundimicrobium sp.]MDO8886898.1 DUF4040 domain-containing protein [Candidatus Oleimmundimicrobium sp.]